MAQGEGARRYLQRVPECTVVGHAIAGLGRGDHGGIHFLPSK
jgi:hypothetical protein